MKEKSSGRHPYAWNPDYCWQFLRRSKSYQEAVASFVESAKLSGDAKSLHLFDVLAGRRSSPDVSDFIDYIQKEEPVERTKEIQRWNSDLEDGFIFGTASIPVENDRLTFAIDTKTTHYQNFLIWFGDVIRFPIDPTVEAPAASYLNAVWNLRPAIFTNGRYAEIQQLTSTKKANPNHAANVKTVTLAINLNFPASAIKETVGEYIDQMLALTAHKPTEPKRPRWDEIQAYIQVLDLRAQKDQRGQRYGYERIGKALAPAEYSDDAKMEWAKSKVRYLENELMPAFFERQSPLVP